MIQRELDAALSRTQAARHVEVAAYLQTLSHSELVAYCTGVLMSNGASVPLKAEADKNNCKRCGEPLPHIKLGDLRGNRQYHPLCQKQQRKEDQQRARELAKQRKLVQL